MGSGCKSDPTRVQVGDISETVEDPLSRSTRRGLRAKGIERGVQVVFSTEKPSKEGARLLPLSEEEFLKGSVDELSALPNFRVRILPVVGNLPLPIYMLHLVVLLFPSFLQKNIKYYSVYVTNFQEQCLRFSG